MEGANSRMVNGLPNTIGKVIIGKDIIYLDEVLYKSIINKMNIIQW